MLGMVLIVCEILCLKPPTNAQYGACGSTAAVLIHSITFSSIQVFLYFSVPTFPPRYLCPSLVILILVPENILFVRGDVYLFLLVQSSNQILDQ